MEREVILGADKIPALDAGGQPVSIELPDPGKVTAEGLQATGLVGIRAARLMQREQYV